MELNIIKSKKEYTRYINWVDNQFDQKVKPNSTEGKKVAIALLLIKQYEDEHFAIPVPNAIDAIKIKMQDLGLQNKDLVGKIGSKGYVSAILNKKKPLTFELAKLFHKEFKIPASILLAS